jgi:phospholipid transport system substrate-binding protein
MMYRRHFLLLLALLAPTWCAATAAAPDDPTALVKRTTDRMLSTLTARRAEVDKNPALIYGMIESIVAPHFDFEKITQGALGQHWREASPSQQRDLVNNFKQVLIRTYARSILNYSGQEIRYLPVKPGGSKGSTITVSTEVRGSGTAPIPIDYRMYDAGAGWKVYDVVINNASLVGNYRSSFATQIRQDGIDGLISKLGDMNRKGQG